MGTRPAATVIAEPPDDPAGDSATFQGLRVAPQALVSVVPSRPKSEVVVFPSTMSPAWLSASA